MVGHVTVTSQQREELKSARREFGQVWMIVQAMLVTLLPVVMAGAYDACGRPDAAWASWDQVIFHAPPNHRHAPPPCATPPRYALDAHCQPCRVDRGINGRSVGYGAIQSGDDIYIIGDACASPSHT